MDHAYIAEHGLIDRYRRGRLDPEEEARFEEHFLGCAECAEELDAARSFQRGLQAMAVEDAAQAVRQAVAAAGLFAWLARRGRLVQGTVLAAAFLLAAAVPAAWWAGSRSAARGAAGAGAWKEPLLDAPLVVLHTFRDEPGAATAVTAEEAARPLSLAVDVGDAGGGAAAAEGTWRVELRASSGRLLLRREGLRANALGVLMMTFPAGYFAPGEYSLSVSAVAAAGGASLFGSFPLRVAAPAPGAAGAAAAGRHR